MTDTINNVPRELLDSLLTVIESNGYAADEVEVVDELRVLLSAPSPAGVDWLPEFLTPELKAIGESAVAKAVADQCYSVPVLQAVYAEAVLLSVTAEAQAIIDGLRGENKALHAQVKVLQSDANSWQSGYDEGRRMGGKHCSLTIDQQAQRIGELEGLLHAESARVDFLDAYIVTADAPDTGKVAMLADSGTLRECIDAALSDGKEGE